MTLLNRRYIDLHRERDLATPTGEPYDDAGAFGRDLIEAILARAAQVIGDGEVDRMDLGKLEVSVESVAPAAGDISHPGCVRICIKDSAAGNRPICYHKAPRAR